MDAKTAELDCGIAPSRIIGWLEDELALAKDEAGTYLFEHGHERCTIEATPLGKSGPGQFALERTQLAVCGNKHAADAFLRLFTLRFLSAGG